MYWKEILKPGDWVILMDQREAVIIGKREEGYWVEIKGVEREPEYQLIETSSIWRISKNLAHWLRVV